MPNDDRTEAPTAKRRSEAREKGQVAKSTDLNGAVVMIAGLIGLVAFGATIGRSAASAMQDAFSQIARPANVSSAAGLHGLAKLVEMTVMKTVAPIAGACLLMGIFINVAQAGLKFSPKAVTPSWERLNPVAGAKRIFGPKAAFETGKAIVKVVVVGGAVALALIPEMTHLSASLGTTPGALSTMLRSSITGLAMRAVAGYLLIGLVDYAWQRRQVENSLKMTKQEVRDEAKQHDLPAEVKTAIRRRQIQTARSRMMAKVPDADVIITNPTHFAVALSYDGDFPAPVVVAKGKDNVALAIRRIAEEHNIAIVENPPLARELHRSVEIDTMIPSELFAAVAEVLAFVYRMAARKRVGV